MVLFRLLLTAALALQALEAHRATTLPQFMRLKNPSRHLNGRSGYLYMSKAVPASRNYGLIGSPDIGTESSKSQEHVPFHAAKHLFPLYTAFLLDSIAIGITLPLLPTYIVERGASTLEMSVIVSSSFLAQVVGSVLMDRFSDIYGRKLAVSVCLVVSVLAYIILASASTLTAVASSRLLAGCFGCIIPLSQAAIADVTSDTEKPKSIGRLQALRGVGFIAGPAVLSLLPNIGIRTRIRISATLPLLGLSVMWLFFKDAHVQQSVNAESVNSSDKDSSHLGNESVPLAVQLLVLNSFAVMYALSTENIYGMLVQDAFGHGEGAVSMVFAVSGMVIAAFQSFFINPLIHNVGKLSTLAIGNLLMVAGMLGVALLRVEAPHFFSAIMYVLGYSIADTALVALLAKYSSQRSLSTHLAYSQASQSCARIISPILAGILYERSKVTNRLLPQGALPYLCSAVLPLIACSVPSVLHLRNFTDYSLREKDWKVQFRG